MSIKEETKKNPKKEAEEGMVKIKVDKRARQQNSEGYKRGEKRESGIEK